MERIKNSLSAKIFFGIAAILLAVSLAMFGLLRIFMPKTYENELGARLTVNTQMFAKELETAPQDRWENMLIQFCLENSIGATIFNENREQIVGFSISSYTEEDGIVTQDESKTSTSFSATFENDGKLYFVAAYLSAEAAAQVSSIFTKIFPYVLAVIIIMSTVVAFFYSRFLHLQAANARLQEDIEREREQERRRRDFFSAISHELKTPVTILKGELDGMISSVGKFKDRDKYLQEAYQTTESIEKLVREILTLAKLDTLNLHIEETPLASLVDEGCRMFELMAHDKHINIERRYDDELKLHADKNQMQTALSNIIANAVKHSPEGSVVSIRISQKDGKGILTVENSGVHIGETELPQIWEPFYRTDKSRSRDTGGSGLGLYIVKTILDLHGFEYRMENTDAGMRFIIVFSLRECG